jgi:hypothetical protein
VIAAVPGQTAERRDPADLVRAETVEKGHGRIEIRRIRVRTKLPARLDQAWSGLKAICRDPNYQSECNESSLSRIETLFRRD